MIKLLVLVFVLTAICHAKIWRTQSVAATEVQDTVNAATAGDTILLPDGTATYTATERVILNKPLKIFGSGIDKTIIVDGTGSTFKNAPITMNGQGGYLTRISGIKFRGNVTDGSGAYGCILIDTLSGIPAKGRLWQVDHCLFDSLKDRGIYALVAGAKASICNCKFTDWSATDWNAQGLTVYGADDSSWNDDWTGVGSDSCVLIERCYWDYRHDQDGAIDNYEGARLGLRHCISYNTVFGCHGFDSGNHRSTIFMEFYKNVTQVTTGNMLRIYSYRGGTGVVWGNVVFLNGNSLSQFVQLQYYRSCCGDGFDCETYLEGCAVQRCDGSSNCTKTRDPFSKENSPADSGRHSGSDNASVLTISGKNWSENQWTTYYLYNVTDGSAGYILSNTTNSIAVTLAGGTDNDFDTGDSCYWSNGYPCLDQTGRAPQQRLEPMYAWNNNVNGVGGYGFEIKTYGFGDCDYPHFSDHIKEGRDYYNNTQKPGYVPLPYPDTLSCQMWYTDTAKEVLQRSFTVEARCYNDTGKIVLLTQIKNGAWERSDSINVRSGNTYELTKSNANPDTIYNVKLAFYGADYAVGLVDTVGYDSVGFGGYPGYWQIKTKRVKARAVGWMR